MGHIVMPFATPEENKKNRDVRKESMEDSDRALDKMGNKKGNAITYGVYTSENKLYASAVFFFFKTRAYYILVGNHPRGRNSGASHYLINEFIRDHCEQNLVLDFEGSNISTIARFYKGFGAVEEVYPGVKVNRLPAISKLFLK